VKNSFSGCEGLRPGRCPSRTPVTPTRAILLFAAGQAELDLDPDCVVGDVWLLRAAVFFEVDDVVVGQQVQIVVDVVHVTVEAFVERAEAGEFDLRADLGLEAAVRIVRALLDDS
jgi:hypothetical protein